MSNRTKERVIALIDSPSESPRERARILEGTLHLSRWMGCGLRVISGNVFEVLALTRAMRRSGPWARIQVSFVGLGTDSPGGSSGIEKILAMDQELIVLAVSKKEASSTELVGWKRKIAERSAAPVLLLPPRKNIAETGFASLLVPMSGEARLNSALAWAVRAANEHHIPVDVLHVTENGLSGCECDRSVIGHVSDQFYHEYPELIDQFISQAIPYSSSREKQVIRKFVHCGGLPGNQIAETIPKLWEGLLVLEWKGTLEKGRAFLIKRMLTRGNIPILLVRHQEQGKSKLKVGRSFEAA